MFDRRTFLRTAGFSAGAAAVATMSSGGLAFAAGAGGTEGRFDVPRRGYASRHTHLRPGSAASAGLDAEPLHGLTDQLDEWTKPMPETGHPMYPGAVVLLASEATVVCRKAIGTALKYADVDGTVLAEHRQIPMRTDTIFDLASLTKLFTSVVTLQLIEDGTVDKYAPVAKYVPEFAANGKSEVTVEQLLTHTSGFRPDPKPSLWEGYDTIPERVHAILTTPLMNPPGSTYLYSDLNMMSLQQLVERLTGDGLDDLVSERIARRIGMHDTMFNPPEHLKRRVAPTEYQVGAGSSGRGLVWGEVHDENAWALGGVAGHAGLFSTVDDLARFGQALLNGGSYGGRRMLEEHTVDDVFTNYNQRFPGQQHGLGAELDQIWYMGGLASPRTAGHTGFTGTSIVVDTESRSVAVLLTNRVHPSREWSSGNPARRACGTQLARAYSVHAPTGAKSWYAPLRSDSTATLVVGELATSGKGSDVAFDAFLDTESTDTLVCEASTDGTTWQPLSLTATGPGAPDSAVDALSGHGHRSWWHVTARSPAAGRLSVRWRYVTDELYTGRGVNIAGVLVRQGERTVLEGDVHPGAFEPDGWRLGAR